MPTRREVFLLVVCLFVVCLGLFVEIDTGANWFFWGPFFDAGHYPLFFVVTIVALRLSYFLPESLPTWLRLPYIPLTVVVIAVELIQPFFERSASMVDVQNGLLGIAAAAVVVETIRRTKSLFQHALILAYAAVLVIPLLWPTRGSFQAIQWRKENFPTIASFSAPQESLLWGDLEPNTAEFQDYSKRLFVKSTSLKNDTGLLVSTSTGYWAGVAYSAGDLDWSKHSKLQLLIVNPEKLAFRIFLRVDDPSPECSKVDGRFNKVLKLNPGPNLFEIPLVEIEHGPKNRKLDLNTIRRMLLFVDKFDDKRIFIIDEARLI